MLIIRDEMPTDETNRQADSDLMSQLVFTRYNSHSYSHLTHSLYYMKETSGELSYPVVALGELASIAV